MVTQIAKFMGQHGAHLGPVSPRWAPCCPHEPCYRGSYSCKEAVLVKKSPTHPWNLLTPVNTECALTHCGLVMPYGSGHEGVAVLLPGFAIS